MSIDYSKVENVALTRTEEDYVMQNLTNMLRVVGEDFRLTPVERKSINGINHANKGFVQDALEAIRAYDEMLPGYIDKDSIEKAWEYYLQLERAKFYLDRLAEVVRDRKQVTGALLFRDSRTVYHVLKAGDSHAIGGLETLLKRMKARFLGQGGSSTSDEEAMEMPFVPDSNFDGGGAEEGEAPGLAA